MAPISNDLLLAAALTSAVPAALAQTTIASNTPRTGVATTITSNAARGATSSTMYIDGTTNQRLTTDASSTLHVLFSDQSALTIGPNSEVMIAKYEFDSKAKNGQILIDLTKGFLRVVGGLISKKTETMVRTSTATIGIRGGITLASDFSSSDNNEFFESNIVPGGNEVAVGADSPGSNSESRTSLTASSGSTPETKTETETERERGPAPGVDPNQTPAPAPSPLGSGSSTTKSYNRYLSFWG